MNENYFSDPDTDNLKKTICGIMPMSASDYELMLPLLQRKTIKKQQHILKEGEICRDIFFLINGFVRMYYIDFDGSEINYRFTDKSNFFVDFQSFLTQKPSRYYWQAMQDSQVLAFPFQEVQRLYASSAAWQKLGRLITESVYLELNERVEMLQFMSPEQRYQHLMDTRPELFNQISQFHMASYLGIKPESLSRLRKRLHLK